ncbi:MAG TPA: ABC transporter ATP-binding protein [Aeromicrobium sp.]|nr:ABC transporter ATP-binding protein [Aeromicrobium sp.]HKY57259.1 ABC transporter ATP-binding protein [Aeromicrobium sp.]
MTQRLTTRGLVKRYGSTVALDGIDLDVEDGAILAVLGPSGCGKTTLLRLIAGFLVPDEGTVSIDGVVVADKHRSVPTRRRDIGLVPQEGALFPHLDVAANIAFGLSRHERSGPRITDLMDLLELPRDLAHRRPAELSGGQQQRVAVARALAPNPRVLLLDEPFSSLDAALRSSTGRSVVNAIRASKATAVLVTHDQDEALSLADKVGVMDRGQLVQADTPNAVYAQPASPFVASFVGEGSLLTSSIRRERGVAYATCSFGELPLANDIPGDTALVFLRPEQVVVRPDPTGEALVSSVAFHGHDAMVRLVNEQSGEMLSARVDAPVMPPVGTRMAVQLRGSALAFPQA